MKYKNLNRITVFLIITMIFAISCKSEKDKFDKAKAENTEKALTAFIQEYPKSQYSDEAKDLRLKLDSIDIIIETYLGNEQRNYYGENPPKKLDTIWRFYLGEGNSPAYGGDKIWTGAGWTGQSLLVREKGELYLIQGAFDYSLRKIKAKTGELVWQYKFDDILKGTGTIWINKHADKLEDRYVIIQGSRKGWNKTKDSLYCTSLRAVSYINGKELWKMNTVATDSYTRDVDGSALVINDTTYLALENGLFTVFNSDYKYAEILDGMMQPKIYKQIKYYTQADIEAHGDDLVPEASPTLYNNRIYTPSGTGWIYGYNINKGANDWEFYIGADLNGTMPLTKDSCLLVSIEKQYIKGFGGVMKLNPRKSPEEAVEWFFPVDSMHWSHWEGGIIGSVTVNDSYNDGTQKNIAIFNDVAGYLYLIDYMNTYEDSLIYGPNLKNKYPKAKLLHKQKTDLTIATPIIVDDIIVAPTDKGLFLYQIISENDEISLELLDLIPEISIDATPIVYDNKIFIASWDGYLYCLGEK